VKLGCAIGGLALAIFLALVAQEMMPSIRAFHGARILLVPMLFCYGALALPFWSVVVLAAYTGFLCDAMYLHVVGGQVEIAMGWSIVYFVLFGAFAHGFQPAFLRGRWWIHVLLSIGGTIAYLGLQYVMVSVRREGIVLNELVGWRILAPGLMAAVVAPLVHLVAVQASNFFPPDSAGFQSMGGLR